MSLNIIYKVQLFNPTSGFWTDIQTFPDGQFNESSKELYRQYKQDNSYKYRLIQIKEELIDIVYPPGS
jgi:hypothetical protein